MQGTFRKLRSVRIGGQAAASGVLLFVGSEAHAAMPGSQTSTAASPPLLRSGPARPSSAIWGAADSFCRNFDGRAHSVERLRTWTIH